MLAIGGGKGSSAGGPYEIELNCDPALSQIVTIPFIGL
jgi:hypothetical protein